MFRIICSIQVTIVLTRILVAILIVSSSQYGFTEEKEEDKRSRTTYFIEVVPGGSAEKAMVEYHKWIKKDGAKIPGEVSYDKLNNDQKKLVKGLMIDLYAAAGRGPEAFKTVAQLIENGLPNPSKEFTGSGYDNKPIMKEVSILMAQARDAMIDEAILKVPEVAEGRWKIGRSDSGNTKSGMKSDLDQTFYVQEWNKETGRWDRDIKKDLDSKFIVKFEKSWNTLNDKLPLDALDIASIAGKHRFPDPRRVDIQSYKQAFRGTIAALRNTPGAYTTYGAVLQSQQLRALWEIEKLNRRAYQQYGPTGEREGKKRVDKLSRFDPEEARKIMFGAGMDPKIMQGLAFGAAVANFIELQHYMSEEKFATKYHLRTWDDSLFTQDLIRRGKEASEKRTTFEKRSKAERVEYNERMLERLFPGDAKSQRRHALALDASADLRNLHNGDYDKIEALEGKDAKSMTKAEKSQAVFDKLARELYPIEYKPEVDDETSKKRNAEIIEAVERTHHRQLATEFCTRSVFSTADEIAALAFALEESRAGWIDVDRLRHVVQDPPKNMTGAEKQKYNPEWETIKSNLQTGARETLFYAFYDLGPEQGAKLLDHLKNHPEIRRHRDVINELDRLWAESQSRWEHFKLIYESRRVYWEYQKKRAAEYSDVIGEQVQRHFWSELGFEKVEDARMAGRWLSTQEMSWNWRKAVRKTYWDPGSADAIAQILRSFFESGGDPEMVAWTIADEMFLALPVIGQVESIRRGGPTGAVLMGSAMVWPPAGGLLLAYSMGQAFYTIIDLEYLRPRATNIVEAAYRGFVGPELYDFGEAGVAGATWDDNDEELLSKAKISLGFAKAPSVEPSPVGPIIKAIRDPAEREKRRMRIAHLEEEIRILEARRKAAEASGGGAWMGGMTTSSAAQPKQKFIDYFVIKGVKPMIGYFARSTVDLRILDRFDPEQKKAQLEALGRQARNDTDIYQRLDASQKMHAVRLDLKRYETAQKWQRLLEEKREINYRFRRDSFYLWLMERYKKADDETVNRWVDTWFRGYEKEVIEELIKIEVLEPGARHWRTPEVTYTHEGLTFEVEKPNPIDMNQLKALVRAEVARGKAMYEQYQKAEVLRSKANDRNLSQARIRHGMEMARPKPEYMDKGKGLRKLVTGLYYAAVPRQAPDMDTTLYKILLPEPKWNDPEQPEYELTVATRLTVDPSIYFKPYRNEVDIVSARRARQQYSGGMLKGMPLLKDTRSLIGELLEENATEVKKNAGVIVLVSAMATDMVDLTHARPETITDLPSVKSSLRANLPDSTLGSITVDGRPGYLMAQTAYFLPAPPPKPSWPMVFRGEGEHRYEIKLTYGKAEHKTCEGSAQLEITLYEDGRAGVMLGLKGGGGHTVYGDVFCYSPETGGQSTRYIGKHADGKFNIDMSKWGKGTPPIKGSYDTESITGSWQWKQDFDVNYPTAGPGKQHHKKRFRSQFRENIFVSGVPLPSFPKA